MESDKTEIHNGIAWAIIFALAAMIMSICSLSRNNERILNFDYLGIIVGILSLLITFLVAWQIYNTISIDRRIDEIARKTEEKIKSYTKAVQKFTIASIYNDTERFPHAFCIFCLAAIEAHKINDSSLMEQSLEMAEEAMGKVNNVTANGVIDGFRFEIRIGLSKIGTPKASKIHDALENKNTTIQKSEESFVNAEDSTSTIVDVNLGVKPKDHDGLIQLRAENAGLKSQIAAKDALIAELQKMNNFLMEKKNG